MPLYVSNVCIGFLFISFVLGFAITPLFMRIFWIILIENWKPILVFLIPTILNAILNKFVVKKIMYENGNFGIKSRLILSYYELYIIYLNILGGVFKAIIRSIIFIAGMFCCFMIGFKELFPNWVSSIFSLDKVYKSYKSMLFNYHQYNNPIFSTFANIMIQNMEEKRKL